MKRKRHAAAPMKRKCHAAARHGNAMPRRRGTMKRKRHAAAPAPHYEAGNAMPRRRGTMKRKRGLCHAAAPRHYEAETPCRGAAAL